MSATLDAVSLSSLLHGHQRDSEAGAEDDERAAPAEAVSTIIEAGQRMDQRGWVQATAGNISLKLADDLIAITRSGCHKGFLESGDVMLVDGAGTPVSPARPSAETLLHCQIYREQRQAGAILHGHSVAATVLSMRRTGDIVLSGYEVLKAFGGRGGHDVSMTVPVFDNDQDIARLAGVIGPHFAHGMPAGYIIRGHGAYAWGPDMPTALARLRRWSFCSPVNLNASGLMEAEVSRLTVYADTAPETPQLRTEEVKAIVAALNPIGVSFERWDSPVPVSGDEAPETLLDAFQPHLDRLMGATGAGSADVIKLTPDHRQAGALREKFLSEHLHTEPEMRFFVQGSGNFVLHANGCVYDVHCTAGDLIGVPAGMKHWFDAGERPCFTALRIFTDTSGWVAHFTGDAISERFPAA